jgi:hypothetical protein
MSKLTDRQLLAILNIHVKHKGRVTDIGNLSGIKHETIMELKKLGLLKIGPRDVDQAEPVKLTRDGGKIANMMLIEGRVASAGILP